MANESVDRIEDVDRTETGRERGARTGEPERERTVGGLSENVAGALAYLFGFLSGIVLYVVADENEFVRFHAAQSVALFGGLAVVSVVLSVLGGIVSSLLFVGDPGTLLAFGLVSLLLTLVWFVAFVGGVVLWAYLMLRAYQGRTPRVPVAAGIADRLV